jgi:mannan endo-1,4-beta-mannosidase
VSNRENHLWRNASRAADRPNHFYAPFPGQASAADFARFKADPLVLFEDGLPDLYRPGAPPRPPGR